MSKSIIYPLLILEYFNTEEEAKIFLDKSKYPTIVIKADNLAASAKGVYICER
jgi:phosphoribosylamine-glycine ligase